MMRFFLKTKWIKTLFYWRQLGLVNLKKVVCWYKNFIFLMQRPLYIPKQFTANLLLTLPQRQQHFAMYNLRVNKQFTVSSGQLLLLDHVFAKCYKRSAKNISTLVLNLKQEYYHILRKIYLFKIKNFNYRQLLLWTKIAETLQPRIKFFLHKKSYFPRWQNKRRIKRVILKQLTKQ